jgi:hypothetical protein
MISSLVKRSNKKAGSEMALPFLSSTYSGLGILAKSCVICYVGGKSVGPKSYEIQTISAIPAKISEAMRMARSILFFY